MIGTHENEVLKLQQDLKTLRETNRQLGDTLRDKELALGHLQQTTAEQVRQNEETIKALTEDLEASVHQVQIAQSSHETLASALREKEEQYATEIESLKEQIDILVAQSDTLKKEHMQAKNALLMVQQVRDRVVAQKEQELEGLKMKLTTKKAIVSTEIESVKKQLMLYEEKMHIPVHLTNEMSDHGVVEQLNEVLVRI